MYFFNNFEVILKKLDKGPKKMTIKELRSGHRTYADVDYERVVCVEPIFFNKIINIIIAFMFSE